LSPLVPEAKNRLKALGVPVPQPDPQAIAWMTAEMNAPRQHETLINKPMALVRTGPKQEMDKAAKFGKPTMTPASESEPGIDILNGGNPTLTGGAKTGIVATITPTPGGASGTTSSAESVTPATDGSEGSPAAQPDAAPASTTENGANATGATGTADSAAKTDATPAEAEQTADGAKADASKAQDGAQNGTSGDNKKESTSKKKKGLKKIVPW
jgi:hypothetical protein